MIPLDQAGSPRSDNVYEISFTDRVSVSISATSKATTRDAGEDRKKLRRDVL
jgi:hypothetical protein